jgi:hypothetical protein
VWTLLFRIDPAVLATEDGCEGIRLSMFDARRKSGGRRIIHVNRINAGRQSHVTTECNGQVAPRRFSCNKRAVNVSRVSSEQFSEV